jgi:hypothetical protein
MPSKAKTNKPKPVNLDTVVIGYIHPGTVSAFFTHSLIMSLMHDQGMNRRIVGIEQDWSSANVSMSRNDVTKRFLDDTDAQWLWWIDSDMAWEPEALEQLLSVADPVTAPIVGGLCFGASNGELFPTIYQLAEVEGKITTVRIHDYEPNTLTPVAATGAAFLLIHRSALEAIRTKAYNKTFTWFQETEMNGRPVGEDITFCLRALESGFKTYVHTGVEVGHHKSQLLTADLHRQQRALVKTDEGTQNV